MRLKSECLALLPEKSLKQLIKYQNISHPLKKQSTSIILVVQRIRFGFIRVHQRICRDELCQCVDVVSVLPV